jgi:hypothetical protein
VTTGEINEGQLIEERVDATMVTTQIEIATVTAQAECAALNRVRSFSSCRKQRPIRGN